LVLDGLDYSSYGKVVAALENGLAKLAKEENFSMRLLDGSGQATTIKTSFKEPIRIESNLDPDNVGNELARSIYYHILK
jgi:hypothetical protein